MGLSIDWTVDLEDQGIYFRNLSRKRSLIHQGPTERLTQIAAQNPEELEGKIVELRNKQKPLFFSYLSVKSQQKTYENGPRIPKPARQLTHLSSPFQKFLKITPKIQKNLSSLLTRNSKSLKILQYFSKPSSPQFQTKPSIPAQPKATLRPQEVPQPNNRLNVGSMVFNQSFFIKSRNKMLNPYTMTFQPYYFIQAPNTTYPQFLFHDQAQLLFSAFGQRNPCQNGISGPAQPSEALKTENGNTLVANTAKANATPTLIQNNGQKGYIIKEKLIKKPANRPATYLTQKKYYLAQVLDQESNSNRRLRPRKIKKKSRDACKAVINSDQAELSPKDRLKDYVTKGDIGSSQYAEEYCRKKDEERSSGSNEAGNNSNDAQLDKEEK